MALAEKTASVDPDFGQPEKPQSEPLSFSGDEVLHFLAARHRTLAGCRDGGVRLFPARLLRLCFERVFIWLMLGGRT